jgi:hypothetical protein
MAIREHYYEVLQTLGEVFCFIFDGITERFSREVEIVGAQYPIAPLKYLRNPLRITYAEGIAMLKVRRRGVRVAAIGANIFFFCVVAVCCDELSWTWFVC